MIIYAPATLADLYDAVKAHDCGSGRPESWAEAQREKLEKIRDAVSGGEEARQFLIQNQDEDPQITQLRNNLFQNIPICESIVDEQSHWLYGTPPERSLRIDGEDSESPATKELNDAFSKGMELNEIDNLYRNLAAPAAFRDRWSWLKTWDQKSTSLTRFSRLLREEVIPVFDPDDRDTLVGVVEVRKVGKTWTRWGYTTKQIAQLKEDWTPDGPVLKNGLARVPYTLLGSMHDDIPHQLGDAFNDQIVAINRRSWYLTGLRLQAQAILVIIGQLLNKEEPSKADGVRRLRIGAAQIIRLAAGDVKSVNPNYDAVGLREAEQSMIREAFDMAKVSPEVADSSRGPQTATEAILRKGRVLADRQRNIRLFLPQEKQAILDWLTVSYKTNRIKVDPARVEIRVTFPDDEQVIAADESVRKQTAMQEVAAVLRTREDYVRTFILKNAPHDQIESYMQELEQALAESRSQQDALFGGLSASITTAGKPAPPVAQKSDHAARIYGTQKGPIDPAAPSPEETPQ